MNGFERKQIELAISKSGYKKKFIAEKIGVTPSRLSQFMSGNFEVPEEKKNELKKFLGI